MFTNKEPDHEAHRVESYFEIHKSKKAILHLILTDRRRENILPDEKDQVRIQHAKPSKRFEKIDKRTPEELKATWD